MLKLPFAALVLTVALIAAPAANAAENPPPARIDLGKLTDQDLAKYAADAAKGDRLAATLLWKVNSVGAKRNPAEALRYLNLAATGATPPDGGDRIEMRRSAWVEAKMQFALLHLAGANPKGLAPKYAVPKDPAKARALMKEAADSGAAPAQFALAELLAKGVGGTADTAAASALVAKAASAGYAPAVYAVGMDELRQAKMKRDDPKYVSGLARIQKAADGGFAPALTTLGELSLPPAGTKGDVSKSIELLRNGLRRGDIRAAHFLGINYLNNANFPRDYAAAGRFLRVASCNNFGLSPYWLAKTLVEHPANRADAVSGYVWARLLNAELFKGEGDKANLAALRAAAEKGLSATEKAEAEKRLADPRAFMKQQCTPPTPAKPAK